MRELSGLALKGKACPTHLGGNNDQAVVFLIILKQHQQVQSLRMIIKAFTTFTKWNRTETSILLAFQRHTNIFLLQKSTQKFSLRDESCQHYVPSLFRGRGSCGQLGAPDNPKQRITSLWTCDVLQWKATLQPEFISRWCCVGELSLSSHNKS